MPFPKGRCRTAQAEVSAGGIEPFYSPSGIVDKVSASLRPKSKNPVAAGFLLFGGFHELSKFMPFLSEPFSP